MYLHNFIVITGEETFPRDGSGRRLEGDREVSFEEGGIDAKMSYSTKGEFFW